MSEEINNNLLQIIHKSKHKRRVENVDEGNAILKTLKKSPIEGADANRRIYHVLMTYAAA
jgi:hypothetical protein